MRQDFSWRWALLALAPFALGQDDIGVKNGYVNVTTANWDISFVKDSGTLASLRPSGSSFDFMPLDFLAAGRMGQNFTYYWGDINVRFRETCRGNWTEGISAEWRTPVKRLDSDTALLASDLAPTMKTGPLKITREWIDKDGDLVLQYTLKNTGNRSVELGAVGFPASLNNIFNIRKTPEMYQKCSFMEPYIGLDAGHLRVTPISGNGKALVVTPVGNTQFEAYRYLEEESHGSTRYQSNGWEGYWEWMVHSKAYADNEWEGVEPWNTATRGVLRPGQNATYALRFSIAEGIREMDSAIRKLDVPTTISVPGYIVPRDIPAQLYLQYSADVASMTVHPEGALKITDQGNKTFIVQPSESAWGRVRLTVKYSNGKAQTIHYYITKASSQAVSDLGNFLTTKQWFDNESDPFGRGPSIMSYDYEKGQILEQEQRTWLAGLSDEGGAGSYVAAAVKQSFQPNAEEIAKLETFIDKVLFKTVQDRTNYTVKRSVFYYDPVDKPEYPYSTNITWKGAFTKATANQINRAYNYVWPTATYWAMYRAARAYPELVSVHDWEWYLNQAYKTMWRGLQTDIGFWNAGLMGETVYGEVLDSLVNEGKTAEAEKMTELLKNRTALWAAAEFPFGSEQAWDCTGQEGVYYWTRRFGYTAMQNKAMNSVLGYMQTIPHWGYNGNARRYWDFVVAGKLSVIERQLHHYGSSLNGLVMLSAFRDNPADSYLLRVGYGGTMGGLSNIHQDGFASPAMHAFPQHLSWDGYSGDYGPSFVGMTLGSGAYLAEDVDVGLVAYGGVLSRDGDRVTVLVRDTTRQKVFIGPVGVEIKVDAGVIESFTYNVKTKAISLKMGQLEGGPKAKSAVVRVSEKAGVSTKSTARVSAEKAEVKEVRGGTEVALGDDPVEVSVALA